MFRLNRFFVLGLAIGGLSLAGCLGSSKKAVDPDDQFGHRVSGESPDGRRTIVIEPAAAEREYRIFPAAVQSVHVRPGPVGDRAEVQVEILVKGAFPDACTELHDVLQTREAHLINVELSMRRPAGAVCASVLRPYRFYLELEGSYAIGAYSLTLNGTSYPFEIRAPAEGSS